MVRKIKTVICQILVAMGIDSRVISGLQARLIPMLAGPVSAFITVWTLDRETQGIFYLFGSLIALRSLFELGVGTSVVQIAAHARAEKSVSAEGKLDEAFVKVVNQWMFRTALIFGALAGLGGAIFIINKGHGDLSTMVAWFGFLAISVIQFESEGRWALLTGADFIVLTNKLRTKNTFIQYGVQWILLLAGTGLFSFMAGSAIAYLSQEYTFRKQFAWLYAKKGYVNEDQLSHYKSELVSLVKKSSQTYLTGYFVFQIQQPICFQILGAAASAKLGFTQSIGSSLIGLSSIWLSTNFPKIAHAVADGDLNLARQNFRSRFVQTIIFASFSFVFAMGAYYILYAIPKFQDRLMDPLSSALLYLGFFIQNIALAMTYWPRAHKIEPFVKVAYTQMIATPIFLWVFVSNMNFRGVGIANSASWLVGLVGIYLIFRLYWNSKSTST